MYPKERHRKPIIRMDPDCAICNAPASFSCDCESKGLETAVQQAEMQMMQTVYDQIRSWVRGHAQDYILEYFRQLTERRKAAHTEHLERISNHAYHYYRQPPHPHELHNAQEALRQGINEDWRSSVQRYPEVLEYFFGLVELQLPGEDDPAVKDPPLSAMNGSTRKNRRNSTIAPESAHERRRRTPPAIADRRAPPPHLLAGGNPMAPVRAARRQPARPPTAPPRSYYGGYPQ
ncbi:hypothetical protein F5Y17DRAFT_467817 [Xylariaceae sp. FL0594]|nr:hypothetical protein F5Y17DRAFT_467817 [Xylariaceae sp. FL0594]